MQCLAKLSSDLTHAVFASAPASVLRMLATLPAAQHANAVQARTACGHMLAAAPPVGANDPSDPSPPADTAAEPLRTLSVATARDLRACRAAASMDLLPAALVLDDSRSSLYGAYFVRAAPRSCAIQSECALSGVACAFSRIGSCASGFAAIQTSRIARSAGLYCG